MDFFLKFLILGGKYLTQITAQSIIEAYKRSMRLRLTLSSEYERHFRMVGHYENILELYNENLDEISRNAQMQMAFISDAHRMEFEAYLKDIEEEGNLKQLQRAADENMFSRRNSVVEDQFSKIEEEIKNDNLLIKKTTKYPDVQLSNAMVTQKTKSPIFNIQQKMASFKIPQSARKPEEMDEHESKAKILHREWVSRRKRLKLKLQQSEEIMKERDKLQKDMDESLKLPKLPEKPIELEETKEFHKVREESPTTQDCEQITKLQDELLMPEEITKLRDELLIPKQITKLQDELLMPEEGEPPKPQLLEINEAEKLPSKNTLTPNELLNMLRARKPNRLWESTVEPKEHTRVLKVKDFKNFDVSKKGRMKILKLKEPIKVKELITLQKVPLKLKEKELQREEANTFAIKLDQQIQVKKEIVQLQAKKYMSKETEEFGKEKKVEREEAGRSKREVDQPQDKQRIPKETEGFGKENKADTFAIEQLQDEKDMSKENKLKREEINTFANKPDQQKDIYQLQDKKTKDFGKEKKFKREAADTLLEIDKSKETEGFGKEKKFKRVEADTFVIELDIDQLLDKKDKSKENKLKREEINAFATKPDQQKDIYQLQDKKYVAEETKGFGKERKLKQEAADTLLGIDQLRDKKHMSKETEGFGKEKKFKREEADTLLGIDQLRDKKHMSKETEVFGKEKKFKRVEADTFVIELDIDQLLDKKDKSKEKKVKREEMNTFATKPDQQKDIYQLQDKKYVTEETKGSGKETKLKREAADTLLGIDQLQDKKHMSKETEGFGKETKLKREAADTLLEINQLLDKKDKSKENKLKQEEINTFATKPDQQKEIDWLQNKKHMPKETERFVKENKLKREEMNTFATKPDQQKEIYHLQDKKYMPKETEKKLKRVEADTFVIELDIDQLQNKKDKSKENKLKREEINTFVTKPDQQKEIYYLQDKKHMSKETEKKFTTKPDQWKEIDQLDDKKHMSKENKLKREANMFATKPNQQKEIDQPRDKKYISIETEDRAIPLLDESGKLPRKEELGKVASKESALQINKPKVTTIDAESFVKREGDAKKMRDEELEKVAEQSGLKEDEVQIDAKPKGDFTVTLSEESEESVKKKGKIKLDIDPTRWDSSEMALKRRKEVIAKRNLPRQQKTTFKVEKSRDTEKTPALIKSIYLKRMQAKERPSEEEKKPETHPRGVLVISLSKDCKSVKETADRLSAIDESESNEIPHSLKAKADEERMFERAAEIVAKAKHSIVTVSSNRYPQARPNPVAKDEVDEDVLSHTIKSTVVLRPDEGDYWDFLATGKVDEKKKNKKDVLKATSSSPKSIETVDATENERLNQERVVLENERLNQERVLLENERLNQERVLLENERLNQECVLLENERLNQERVLLENERLNQERVLLEKERLNQERALLENEKHFSKVESSKTAFEQRKLSETPKSRRNEWHLSDEATEKHFVQEPEAPSPRKHLTSDCSKKPQVEDPDHNKEKMMELVRRSMQEAENGASWLMKNMEEFFKFESRLRADEFDRKLLMLDNSGKDLTKSNEVFAEFEENLRRMELCRRIEEVQMEGRRLNKNLEAFEELENMLDLKLTNLKDNLTRSEVEDHGGNLAKASEVYEALEESLIKSEIYRKVMKMQVEDGLNKNVESFEELDLKLTDREENLQDEGEEFTPKMQEDNTSLFVELKHTKALDVKDKEIEISLKQARPRSFADLEIFLNPKLEDDVKVRKSRTLDDFVNDGEMVKKNQKAFSELEIILNYKLLQDKMKRLDDVLPSPQKNFNLAPRDNPEVFCENPELLEMEDFDEDVMRILEIVEEKADEMDQADIEGLRKVKDYVVWKHENIGRYQELYAMVKEPPVDEVKALMIREEVKSIGALMEASDIECRKLLRKMTHKLFDLKMGSPGRSASREMIPLFLECQVKIDEALLRDQAELMETNKRAFMEMEESLRVVKIIDNKALSKADHAVVRDNIINVGLPQSPRGSGKDPTRTYTTDTKVNRKNLPACFAKAGNAIRVDENLKLEEKINLDFDQILKDIQEDTLFGVGATKAEEYKLFATKVKEVELFATKVEEDKLFATKAKEDKLFATKVEEDKLFATKAKKDKLFATKVEEDKLFATKAKEDKLFATTVKEDKLFATKVKEVELFATKVEKDKLFATKAKEDKLFATTVKEDKLFATKAKEDKLFATTVKEDKLFATKVEEGKLFATKAKEDKLFATTVKDKLFATVVEEDNLFATKLEEDNLFAIRVEEDKFFATKAKENKLFATNVKEKSELILYEKKENLALMKISEPVTQNPNPDNTENLGYVMGVASSTTAPKNFEVPKIPEEAPQAKDQPISKGSFLSSIIAARQSSPSPFKSSQDLLRISAMNLIAEVVPSQNKTNKESADMISNQGVRNYSQKTTTKPERNLEEADLNYGIRFAQVLNESISEELKSLIDDSKTEFIAIDSKTLLADCKSAPKKDRCQEAVNKTLKDFDSVQRDGAEAEKKRTSKFKDITDDYGEVSSLVLEKPPWENEQYDISPRMDVEEESVRNANTRKSAEASKKRSNIPQMVKKQSQECKKTKDEDELKLDLSDIIGPPVQARNPSVTADNAKEIRRKHEREKARNQKFTSNANETRKKHESMLISRSEIKVKEPIRGREARKSCSEEVRGRSQGAVKLGLSAAVSVTSTTVISSNSSNTETVLLHINDIASNNSSKVSSDFLKTVNKISSKNYAGRKELVSPNASTADSARVIDSNANSGCEDSKANSNAIQSARKINEGMIQVGEDEIISNANSGCKNNDEGKIQDASNEITSKASPQNVNFKANSTKIDEGKIQDTSKANAQKGNFNPTEEVNGNISETKATVKASEMNPETLVNVLGEVRPALSLWSMMGIAIQEKGRELEKKLNPKAKNEDKNIEASCKNIPNSKSAKIVSPSEASLKLSQDNEVHRVNYSSDHVNIATEIPPSAQAEFTEGSKQFKSLKLKKDYKVASLKSSKDSFDCETSLVALCVNQHEERSSKPMEYNENSPIYKTPLKRTENDIKGFSKYRFAANVTRKKETNGNPLQGPATVNDQKQRKKSSRGKKSKDEANLLNKQTVTAFNITFEEMEPEKSPRKNTENRDAPKTPEKAKLSKSTKNLQQEIDRMKAKSEERIRMALHEEKTQKSALVVLERDSEKKAEDVNLSKEKSSRSGDANKTATKLKNDNREALEKESNVKEKDEDDHKIREALNTILMHQVALDSEDALDHQELFNASDEVNVKNLILKLYQKKSSSKTPNESSIDEESTDNLVGRLRQKFNDADSSLGEGNPKKRVCFNETKKEVAGTFFKENKPKVNSSNKENLVHSLGSKAEFTTTSFKRNEIEAKAPSTASNEKKVTAESSENMAVAPKNDVRSTAASMINVESDFGEKRVNGKKARKLEFTANSNDNKMEALTAFNKQKRAAPAPDKYGATCNEKNSEVETETKKAESAASSSNEKKIKSTKEFETPSHSQKRIVFELPSPSLKKIEIRPLLPAVNEEEMEVSIKRNETRVKGNTRFEANSSNEKKMKSPREKKNSETKRVTFAKLPSNDKKISFQDRKSLSTNDSHEKNLEAELFENYGRARIARRMEWYDMNERKDGNHPRPNKKEQKQRTEHSQWYDKLVTGEEPEAQTMGTRKVKEDTKKVPQEDHQKTRSRVTFEDNAKIIKENAQERKAIGEIEEFEIKRIEMQQQEVARVYEEGTLKSGESKRNLKKDQHETRSNSLPGRRATPFEDNWKITKDILQVKAEERRAIEEIEELEIRRIEMEQQGYNSRYQEAARVYEEGMLKSGESKRNLKKDQHQTRSNSLPGRRAAVKIIKDMPQVKAAFTFEERQAIDEIEELEIKRIEMQQQNNMKDYKEDAKKEADLQEDQHKTRSGKRATAFEDNTKITKEAQIDPITFEENQSIDKIEKIIKTQHHRSNRYQEGVRTYKVDRPKFDVMKEEIHKHAEKQTNNDASNPSELSSALAEHRNYIEKVKSNLKNIDNQKPETQDTPETPIEIEEFIHVSSTDAEGQVITYTPPVVANDKKPLASAEPKPEPLKRKIGMITNLQPGNDYTPIRIFKHSIWNWDANQKKGISPQQLYGKEAKQYAKINKVKGEPEVKPVKKYKYERKEIKSALGRPVTVTYLVEDGGKAN